MLFLNSNELPEKNAITSIKRRRVVITGAGIVTSLGLGWDANAAGFREGRVALPRISLFPVENQRVQTGGEANLPETLPPTRLSVRHERRMDRAGRLLLHAAHEAWTMAGWEAADFDDEPLPTCLGTSSGGMSQGELFYRSIEETRKRQITRVIHYQSQRQVLDLADAFGYQGRSVIIANACASGVNSIGHAFHLVRSGQARRAFAGGYDGLCQLVFAGFDSLQALSTTRPRPFDSTRDGLAIGEGAAMVCLETLDDATRRGATILAEIKGYGAYTDLHHLTQPQPEGEAALQSMLAACRDAQFNPEEIDYINAHGTGTPKNDSAEGMACQRLRPNDPGTLRVSSTKGSIGHLLGAAGAVEAVICLMALRGQWFPPVVELDEPDPVCTFDLVRQPRDGRIEKVLTNSFGFGGANATLALQRFSAS